MMNLDKRQKVIVALIILALAVLVWQIYKIASSENTAPSATQSTSQPATAAKSTTGYPAAAQAVRNNAVETAVMLSNTANTATSATDAADTVGASQQKYLELVNEYQMSEIQRMIAEDQASIAQARYTAAEALSKISALSGGSANLSDLAGSSDQTNPADYELIYTGEDNGQWTATIKKNGQFNDVTAGTVLPDGANVLTVDDNGVLLQIGSKKELVTFNGVTPFDSTGQSATPANSNAPSLQNQSANKTSANLNPQTTTAPLTQTTITTQTSQPQTTPATAKTTVAQTQTTTVQNNTPSVATPSKPAAPKIAAVVTSSPVPVATSVPDFVPVKQPNLLAANAGKNNTNIVATTTTVNTNTAGGYTIQLVADDSLSSVNNFISVNQLQNNAQALKTSRNGKSWYIVVYGNYPTAADAEKALSTMPSSLHNQHPFIRKLSDIQSKTVS